MKKVLSVLFALLIVVQMGAGAFALGGIIYIGSPEEGGTVTAIDGTDSDGKDCLSITATPNAAAGYELYEWKYTIQGGYYKEDVVNSSTAVTWDFTKYENENRTVIAVFRKKLYSITVNTIGNGSVTGAGDYEFGSHVTLTATPGKGYAFKCWNGNPSMSNPTFDFDVYQNSPFTAEFVGQENTITTSVEPADTGYVIGNQSPYNYATDPVASLSARAVTGYKFEGWYESGNLISTKTDEIFDTDRSRTLVAKFVPESTASIFDPSSPGTGSGPTITVVPPSTSNLTITYMPDSYSTPATPFKTPEYYYPQYVSLGGQYFTRSGYTQTGWTTSPGGSKIYELYASFYLDRNTILYPYWEAVSMPLWLTVNIGTGGYVRLGGGYINSGWTNKLEPGKSYTFYFQPAPNNYVYLIQFAGWHHPPQAGNSFTVTYDMMAGKNQTLLIRFADARSHPPTGDESQTALYAALAIASLAGFVTLAVVKRKRDKEE